MPIKKKPKNSKSGGLNTKTRLSAGLGGRNSSKTTLLIGQSVFLVARVGFEPTTNGL
jgi:hypothetical protein